MMSNVAPQRKIADLFPGKSKQIKAKRRNVESSSNEDLCDRFHDLSDDVTLVSMNIGLFVGMKNKTKLCQMLSWGPTFLSSQGNGF
jgi:hypothetical protein